MLIMLFVNTLSESYGNPSPEYWNVNVAVNMFVACSTGVESASMYSTIFPSSILSISSLAVVALTFVG